MSREQLEELAVEAMRIRWAVLDLNCDILSLENIELDGVWDELYKCALALEKVEDKLDELAELAD